MSLQKLTEELKAKANYHLDIMHVPVKKSNLLRLIECVELMEGVMIILKDDAEFFTGDVRKFTAWEGFTKVVDSLDQIALGDGK